MYTALYRKYRPARFSDVLGQEHIVRTLKNQIVSGKVSHAYLFCGTRGTGKTSLAKIFGKAVNCLSPSGGEPCGVCKLCADIEGGGGFNVLEIDAASNNSVDNIRDIREEVRYTPAEGKYKVYIIDEVHMLSTSAYNALLKTLEEPPSHVIFILATTDPQKIPATIHSRCQRYDFRRISAPLIGGRLSEYLKIEGIEADEDAVMYIARLADGSVRDALSLLDRCISFYAGEAITLERVLEVTGSIDTKSFFELTERLNETDSAGALEIVSKIAENGRDMGQIISDALSHFRNILIAKTTGDPSNILDVSKEAAAELSEQSKKTDTVRIMSYISAFSDLQGAARYSANRRLLLEVEIIKLCNPEIINNSYEELYNKILKMEKIIENGIVPAEASGSFRADNGGETLQGGEKPRPKEAAKKKVAVPADFGELVRKFPRVKERLAENRESLPFLGVLKRAEAGLLDDTHVYIIFEDEANENVLKNDPKRQALLEQAIFDTTGKVYSIKTITKDSFDMKAKGVIITEEEKKKVDEFVGSISEGLDGVEIQYEE